MKSNNWCGSSPVFYFNDSFQILGEHLKNDGSIIRDDVGLFLYLTSGYCLYGKTPYKNISFLRANETIGNRGAVIGNNNDYMKKLAGYDCVSPNVSLELIEKWVSRFEESTSGKIIVPLSGGLDSRLLVSFIKDRSRIEAFTYGQSINQSKSNEVKKAEFLSKKMNFKWKHIELKGYSKYTKDWIERWGSATHAHGMYQMQFYELISELVPSGGHILSGIIGDGLAGSLPVQNIQNPRDLLKLALSHKINAEEIARVHLKAAAETEIDDFLKNEMALYEEALNSKRVIDLMTLQNKNILLRYLIEIPKWYGFECVSPFLDEKIGVSMLCIEDELRNERKWQETYLQEIGLDDLSLGSPGVFSNTLNFVEIRSGAVDLSILENRGVLRSSHPTFKSIKISLEKLQSWWYQVFIVLAQSRSFPLLGRIFMRIVRKSYNQGMKSYYTYLTILPLFDLNEVLDSTENL